MHEASKLEEINRRKSTSYPFSYRNFGFYFSEGLLFLLLKSMSVISTSSVYLAKLLHTSHQLVSLPCLNNPYLGSCSPLHSGKIYPKATALRELPWIYRTASINTSWTILLREWENMCMTQNTYPTLYLTININLLQIQLRSCLFTSVRAWTYPCVWTLRFQPLCQTPVRLLLLSVSNH